MRLVHQAFPEGAFGRDETYGLVAVPLHLALDGRLEFKEALGGDIDRILRQVYPDGSVAGDDAAGVGFDVRSKVLCRRIGRLLGSAGEDGRQRGHQEQYAWE